MKIKRVLLVVGALSNCILLSSCGTKSSGWRYDAKRILVVISDACDMYLTRIFDNEDNDLMYKEESTNKWYRIIIKRTYEKEEEVFQDYPYQIER